MKCIFSYCCNMKVLTFVLFTLFTNPMEVELSESATFSLSGVVVEKDSGEPLTGALIKIQGIEKEYYTDFEGHFNIEALIPGSYDIEISYVSFQSKTLKKIQLDRENNDLFVGLR